MSDYSKDNLGVKDLVDVYLKLNDTINFYWNFYVVSVSGLVFWILNTNTPFDVETKSIISVGFTVFAFMNGLGIYKHYMFFQAIGVELTQRAKQMEFDTKFLPEILDKVTLKHSKLRVGIHIMIDLILLTLIWTYG